MSESFNLEDADGLPVIVDPLNAKQWEEIQKSALGPRMKRALMRVAAGVGSVEASKCEGYETHSEVYRYAVRFKLIDLKTSKIVEQHRRVAVLANAELEERLLTKPEEIKDRDLIVAAGVATDKVFISEKGSTDDGRGYMSEFEKAAKRIVDSGAEVAITVAIKPAGDDEDSKTVQTVSGESVAPHEVIDVTPAPSVEPTQPD